MNDTATNPPPERPHAVMVWQVLGITEEWRDRAFGETLRQADRFRALLGLAPGEPAALAPRCPKCGHVEKYAKAEDVPLADVPCPLGCANVWLVKWHVPSKIVTPAQMRRAEISRPRIP